MTLFNSVYILHVVPLLLSLSSGVRCDFCFLASPFSHCVLCHQSPTPSIFCCCSSFFSQSLQISLNAVLPSYSRSSSSPFPLHFLGICSLCQFFISHSFYMSGPFQPTPHQFLLNTFLHSLRSNLYNKISGIIVITKYCIKYK